MNYLKLMKRAQIGLVLMSAIAAAAMHVVLMEDSLTKVVQAVEVSRGAVRLIKQNNAIVVGLNTLALALALPGGLVSSATTALISNGSAVIASLNGMRPLVPLR